MKLTIYGPPRSKKNSQQPFRMGPVCPTCRKKTGRILIQPSKAWREWRDGCDIVTHGLRVDAKIAKPVNCRAIFYMPTRRSVDACNMYEGLADLLEHYKIVENDKYLVSWDGSRIRVDKANPRVEVELCPVEES